MNSTTEALLDALSAELEYWVQHARQAPCRYATVRIDCYCDPCQIANALQAAQEHAYLGHWDNARLSLQRAWRLDGRLDGLMAELEERGDAELFGSKTLGPSEAEVAAWKQARRSVPR